QVAIFESASPFGIVERTPLFQRVAIGRVVIDRRRLCETSERATHHVALGGMKVATRWIDAERPARGSVNLPGRKSQRVTQQIPESRGRQRHGRRPGRKQRVVRDGYRRGAV